ncbi:Coenzyme PQQ synthesis protein A (modular protein) [Pseudomonas sp. OF001]|nr:Coenzyme PQQ synthesis protein A (modular protein) [Pseudomonas sp. OF001]
MRSPGAVADGFPMAPGSLYRTRLRPRFFMPAGRSAGRTTKDRRNSFQSTIWRARVRAHNCLAGIHRFRQQEDCAMWTKPAFTDLRIGFEVTMYFANR